MKKILFITWTFSMGGGAEKMLSTLVNHLDEEKFEIDILEIGRFGTNLEKTKDNVRILKPMLNPIEDSKIVHYFKWQLLKYAPYILRLFRTKKKYDYEIAFNYLYPVYALNKTSKSIAWNHGSIYNLLNEEKNRKKLEKKLLYVNKIVAISEMTFDSINEVYPMYSDKLCLLNNGYDFKEIKIKSEQSIENNFEEDSLLFIGRVEKAKGIIELLDLFLEIVKVYPNKKLYLLGTGELDSFVKDFITKHNLEKNIIPLGYVKNPYPYIKIASFVILLSHAEGFPTVFVEGLSLGTGFVSTPVGGTKELSNGGECGFVSSDNTKLKEYLIEELGKNKEDRQIQDKKCIEFVQKYDVKEQVKKFEELLEGL